MDAEKLEQRISTLEAEVAMLKQSLLAYSVHGTTLQAPVRIVDAEGRLLAELRQAAHDLSLRLYNAHGTVAASIGVDGTEAGYLAVRNAEGGLVAYLEVEEAGARLVVQDHAADGGVVIYGGNSRDNSGGAVSIGHTGYTVSLGLWSVPGGGELVVFDEEEHEIVRLPAKGAADQSTAEDQAPQPDTTRKA